jgi:hypothetical protein
MQDAGCETFGLEPSRVTQDGQGLLAQQQSRQLAAGQRLRLDSTSFRMIFMLPARPWFFIRPLIQAIQARAPVM